jgi:predicted esterase
VAIAAGCASSGEPTSSGGTSAGNDGRGVSTGADASTSGSSSGGSSSGGDGGSNSDGGTSVSDASTGKPDSSPGPVNWDAGVPVSASCSPITSGWSTPSSISVNGKTRKFFVQLPNDTSNMALLFLWHGWNQDTATFAQQIVYDVPSAKWVPFDPNAFRMPLMIVTPVDTGLFAVGFNGSVGLDWDIQPMNPPIDVQFFEGMLQCIQQQFTIDKSHIYSFGFSAGAVMSNLLSAVYPHLFAATISESGAWLNDQAEWVDMTLGAAFYHWDWPAFGPADKGNVLMTHGGNPNGPIQGDVATIILIQAANQAAVPFLYNNDRTVTECTHGFGHAPDADLTQSMYYEYMWDHHLGGPPLTGLPPDFPTTANPLGSTYCVFHSAP